MIRILHTADVHLDSPLRSLALRDPELRDVVQAASRRAFQRIIDAALEHDVQALLIAGDLYDGQARSAQTAAFLVTQLDRLRAAAIPVFLIKGNHDAENPLTGDTALPDNVHLFDARGGRQRLPGTDVWIHGVSFAQRHAPDSLLPKFAAPEPDAVNIAMLHTSLGGTSGHDVYAPCTPAELTALGFDYWALGHIHIRSQQGPDPWIVMPGIPQGRDSGEAGAKSATLLSIEDGAISVSEIPTSVVVFETLDQTITGIDTEDSLRAALRSAFARIAQDAGAGQTILRLRLTGHGPLAWQLRRDQALWLETAKTLAQGTGRLWVEKLTLATEQPEASSPGALEDLASLMREVADTPGLIAEAAAEIETLLAELPPARRAALMPDEDAARRLARQLLRDGEQEVLARMRGVPQ